MLPLTLAIIARDEADRIGAAIASVPGCAEVLVLDSGSEDATLEVARELGARVVQTDWPGHVAQKNRALDRATQPWVLSLDADERLSREALEAVRRAIEADHGDGFALLRRNHWLGRPLRGGSFGPAWHLRLVRRDKARWGGEDPHDQLTVRGAVGRLEGFLEHHPYRDLGEHLATIDRYSARFVEESVRKGRRAGPLDLLLRPPWHLLRSYVLQGGFRDGAAGLVVAWLGATHVALKWGRLLLARVSDS